VIKRPFLDDSAFPGLSPHREIAKAQHSASHSFAQRQMVHRKQTERYPFEAESRKLEKKSQGRTCRPINQSD
jgi:hypothetical protein